MNPLYQFQFLKSLPSVEKENNIENIPTWFWLSRTIYNLPKYYKNRKALLKEIFDLDHSSQCQNTNFHVKIDHENCKCIVCNKPMSNYRYRFCEAQVIQ